jgi:protein-S-isoprenylcysteine O-methyltransferase Ste14
MSVFIAPLIVILLVVVYGVVHSLLASNKIKHLVRNLFGSYTGRWYRLAYNIFAFISLLPVLALPALLPDKTLYVIPPPWMYLMSLSQVLAVGLLIIGFLQTGMGSFLGIRQLIIGDDQAQTCLEVRGLYRYVRHPLYTAGLLFIWMTPVMTINVLALYLGLTVYIIIGAYLEEGRLVQEFGAAYEDYKKGTPMLVPFVKGSIR